MPSLQNAPFRLAVFAAGGKASRQCFPEGAGPVGGSGHLPINFHAFAAATQGAYYSGAESLPDEEEVLLLIGQRVKFAEAALKRLLQHGKRVVLAFKETGLPQINRWLQKYENWAGFCRLCERAHGALVATQETEPLFLAARPFMPILFQPPPYPVEEWDLSCPESEQKGVFLGTRQLFMNSRLHAVGVLTALSVINQTHQSLTLISGRASDLTGWRRMLNPWLDFSGKWHDALAKTDTNLRLIKKQLPTWDYLRLMASHLAVFQLDQTSVPGQVAGDALLCRLPCVGGNGAVERICYPDLCGHGRSVGELQALLRQVITDGALRKAKVEAALELAAEHLSFSAARMRIQDFWAHLPRG